MVGEAAGAAGLFSFFRRKAAFLGPPVPEGFRMERLPVGGGMETIMKKVAVIMGSDSDFPVVEKALKVLEEYGVPYEAHVMSAHRTPASVSAFVSLAEENGFGVVLAAAGMAAHLAGVCAANTVLPVIGIPVKGGAMDGLDALLATVQMPSGVPVATVALNGAANAAYLACEILALSDGALSQRLKEGREAAKAAIAEKDAALQQKLKK